ncbi:hypothetical protein Tco_0357379 [Tanacetum coccineum]
MCSTITDDGTRGTKSGKERFKKFANYWRRWWGAPCFNPFRQAKESGIKDILLAVKICTEMSPGESIVGKLEYVESFFAVHTPPDHLIRTDFEQEGVVPKIVLYIFEELVFLLG